MGTPGAVDRAVCPLFLHPPKPLSSPSDSRYCCRRRMTFEIGQTVGDYQILAVLGRGGMGAVYKVRNTLTDREEAMKVVLPGNESSTEEADRFLREIRIQAKLQHPHIAAIRTAFRSSESVLLIMELIDGSGLDTKLHGGPLPLGETFRIIDDILGALSHAHAKGIVHRDIKPSNIIVTPRGAPKLTDFGIAIGSLAYMSPEQVMSKPLDERSDLYSLGITVYEMLTGRRPFQNESEYQIMNAHLKEAPASPGSLVRSIPLAISVVVLKSLAKAPADRYQTAAEFQGAWRQAFFGGDEAETVALAQASAPPGHVAPIDPKDLARIESGLTRVLGPIARNLVAREAARHHSPDTLARQLATQIPREEDREAFLKSCGTASGQAATPSGSQKAAALDEKSIEAAKKALAVSMGPIAAMVVARAAKRAHSAAELRDALAAEIPGEKDRKAFLAAFPG